MRVRQELLADSLSQIYAALDDDQQLLLEYKFFEPYFYTTDIPDWGTALGHVLALGERAVVCLDTGHHAPGTNIEFIVMQLLRAGRLGAFDFNSRFYADDDLIVGYPIGVAVDQTGQRTQVFLVQGIGRRGRIGQLQGIGNDLSEQRRSVLQGQFQKVAADPERIDSVDFGQDFGIDMGQAGQLFRSGDQGGSGNAHG